jgi:transcriptional regulator with XRE-family HTH domain
MIEFRLFMCYCHGGGIEMTVCEKIDTIIKAKGMSRRSLAIQAGIKPSSLQSAMQRNGQLSLDMLIPICKTLYLPQSFFEFNAHQLRFLQVHHEKNKENILQGLREGTIEDSDETRETMAMSSSVIESATILIRVLDFENELDTGEIPLPKDFHQWTDEDAKNAIEHATMMARRAEAMMRIYNALANLNDLGLEKVADRVDELLEIPRYRLEEDDSGKYQEN